MRKRKTCKTNNPPDISACQTEIVDSMVKVEDFNKKAVFRNPKKNKFRKIRVDGCVISNSLAADYVVSKIGVGDIIVELKGRDVEHALKQVISTADFWTRNNLPREGPWAALIIATQAPGVSTALYRGQDAFMKKFGGRLHLVNKSTEFVFESVLNSPHPLRAAK